MARGKRNLTAEEKLQQINAEIANAEEQLKALKAQRKELEDEKEQEELRELREIILSSGKTLDDVKAMLAQK